MSLPNGWSNTNFEVILSSITNGIPDKQNKETTGIPVTRIETIASEIVNLEKIGFVDGFDNNKLEKYKLNKGDILFSHINSPLHLGKTAIFEEQQLLYHGTNLLRLVVDPKIYDFRLFNYYCKYLRMTGEFSQQAQHAVNQSSLNQKKLKAFDILLPPLNEQKRIAKKLYKLLATVESIKTRLENAPTIIKRFRQSILAAAISGKLTEEWREENEVGFKWKNSSVGEIVYKIESGKSIKCIEIPPHDDEKGIVKISAVTWGSFNEEESKTLPNVRDYLDDREIQSGDFLISRANTLELVGAVVIVEKISKTLMLSDKVLRLVMDDKNKKWLKIVLNSSYGRNQIESRATGNQLSMRNLSQKALLSIPVPSPSSEEQKEIVSQVESLFTIADTLEEKIEAAKKRVDRLTQSILAKAFRGELIPQDPNDEPAEKLLELIRVEQEKTRRKKG